MSGTRSVCHYQKSGVDSFSKFYLDLKSNSFDSKKRDPLASSFNFARSEPKASGRAFDKSLLTTSYAQRIRKDTSSKFESKVSIRNNTLYVNGKKIKTVICDRLNDGTYKIVLAEKVNLHGYEISPDSIIQLNSRFQITSVKPFPEETIFSLHGMKGVRYANFKDGRLTTVDLVLYEGEYKISPSYFEKLKQGFVFGDKNPEHRVTVQFYPNGNLKSIGGETNDIELKGVMRGKKFNALAFYNLKFYKDGTVKQITVGDSDTIFVSGREYGPFVSIRGTRKGNISFYDNGQIKSGIQIKSSEMEMHDGSITVSCAPLRYVTFSRDGSLRSCIIEKLVYRDGTVLSGSIAMLDGRLLSITTTSHLKIGKLTFPPGLIFRFDDKGRLKPGFIDEVTQDQIVVSVEGRGNVLWRNVRDFSLLFNPESGVLHEGRIIQRSGLEIRHLYKPDGRYVVTYTNKHGKGSVTFYDSQGEISHIKLGSPRVLSGISFKEGETAYYYPELKVYSRTKPDNLDQKLYREP